VAADGPGAPSFGDLAARAARLDTAAAADYPGPRTGRQPIHTVYVPADRFEAGTARRWGDEALRLLDRHTDGDEAFAAALGLTIRAAPAGRARQRVARKLADEPVEDLRVDFEDGYGIRDDATEDAHAAAAARALAADASSRPAGWGLRVKPMCDGLASRGLRTLDVFLTAAIDTAGALPDGFVVTLPKVLGPGYVAVFAEALGRLESSLGLAEGALVFEIQVETPQSVVGLDGRFAPRLLADAAAGRCVGAHMGTFDYTAALGLLPREQRITHPACDFARHVLQVSLAGSGVRLSDGSTNVTPASDATADVHAAWRTHSRQVRHSLASGFFQGWDLHPAQLVSRFGAVFAYLLEDMDDVLARLAAWRDGEPGPGGVLDEPATARALSRHVDMAVACGALSADDVPPDISGLPRDA
jgi:hypothetical protein